MTTDAANRWLILSVSVGCLAWATALTSEFWALFLCAEKIPVTSADFELYPSCDFRSIPGVLTAWVLACVAAIGGAVGYYKLRSKRAVLMALPAWLFALPPIPFVIWYIPGYIAKNVL